jgi:hypothetical protein
MHMMEAAATHGGTFHAAVYARAEMVSRARTQA